jgi:hypothetical protein
VLMALDGRLRGKCSLCPESIFSIKIEPYDQASYDSDFRLHLEQAHKNSARPAEGSETASNHQKQYEQDNRSHQTET